MNILDGEKGKTCNELLRADGIEKDGGGKKEMLNEEE
jgi:hypothetical protein